MTGIFGLAGLDGKAVERHQIDAMARTLGADVGTVRLDQGVGLGPDVASDSRLTLVSDGRVDNRRDLGADLGIGEPEVLALPTSALIRIAYQRWGEDCLDRLVGEFTFAVWDRHTRTLRVGASAPLAPPLYYHGTRELFAFASRARGLIALPHVPRAVDEEHVAAFLTGADTGLDRSFFRGVRRVLPGQLVTVDSRGLTVGQWWRPDVSHRLELGGDEEYLEAFAALLERVIADHLGDGDETGILLSGGLDSGAVAAVAAPALQRSDRRLSAYTEVPHRRDEPVLEGRYADETPYVEALASRHHNVDLHLVRTGPRGLLDEASRFFSAAETPFRNAANRGWMEAIYARSRADGVRTLLNGDQGNLTVSWAGTGLLTELLGGGRIGQALREARAVAHAGRSGSTARVVLRDGLRPLLPQAFNVRVDALRAGGAARDAGPYGSYSLIAPGLVRELDLVRRDGRLPARTLGTPERDLRVMRLRVLSRTGARGAGVVAGYRDLFGVDIRTPLADRRLVEFCLRLPETQYAREGQDRWLIRRAMAGRLPNETLSRRLRGLQAACWFGDMTREREDLLASVGRFEGDDLTRRVLDLPRLRRLLEHWPTRTPTAPRDVALYRGAVGTALMTGAFLLWAQET